MMLSTTHTQTTAMTRQTTYALSLNTAQLVFDELSQQFAGINVPSGDALKRAHGREIVIRLLGAGDSVARRMTFARVELSSAYYTADSLRDFLQEACEIHADESLEESLDSYVQPGF